MRKLFFLFLLSLVPLLLPAKDCLFCKGKVLVYEVNNFGRSSLLLVKLKKVSSKKVEFEWMTTMQPSQNGSIQLDAPGLESGMEAQLTMNEGTEANLGKRALLWMSRKAFKMINRGDLTSLNFGSETLNLRKDGPFLFNPAIYPPYGELPTLAAVKASDEGGRSVIVYQSEETPVVLAISMGWEMKLVAVF